MQNVPSPLPITSLLSSHPFPTISSLLLPSSPLPSPPPSSPFLPSPLLSPPTGKGRVHQSVQYLLSNKIIVPSCIPRSSHHSVFDHLHVVCKNGGRRPGSIYHVSDIIVHLSRLMGEGSRIERARFVHKFFVLYEKQPFLLRKCLKPPTHGLMLQERGLKCTLTFTPQPAYLGRR